MYVLINFIYWADQFPVLHSYCKEMKSDDLQWMIY